MPLAAALEIARPFFDELGAVVGDGRVVMVPGNHDHHLLDDWLERRRLDGAAPLGLEQRIPIDAGPLAELTARDGQDRGRARVPRRVAAGRASTPPTATTSIATSPSRASSASRSPRSSESSAAPGTRPTTSSLPTATRDRSHRTTTSASRPRCTRSCSRSPRAAARRRSGWAGQTRRPGSGRRSAAGTGGRLAYAAGCSARLRYPGRSGSRIGSGSDRSSPISHRARSPARGLAAIGEVVRQLGIEADHVIFGHTHRRGPIRARSGGASKTGPGSTTPAAGSTRRDCSGARRPTAPTGRGRSIVLEGERRAALDQPARPSRPRRSCAEAIEPPRAPAGGLTLGVRLSILTPTALGPLGPSSASIGDLRAIGERRSAIGDPGLMDEQVLPALVRGDETESLLLVEPLHGAGRHTSSLCCHGNVAGTAW